MTSTNSSRKVIADTTNRSVAMIRVA
jgi:hypothetical protein